MQRWPLMFASARNPSILGFYTEIRMIERLRDAEQPHRRNREHGSKLMLSQPSLG